MLIGTYKHSIDGKGRIAVPAKFRPELGEAFVATRGTAQCVALYPAQQWEKIIRAARRKMTQARFDAFSRLYFPAGDKVELDAQGRISLTAELRSFAGLENNAVIIGAGDRVEVWNPDNWQQVSEQADQELLLQMLDDLIVDD